MISPVDTEDTEFRPGALAVFGCASSPLPLEQCPSRVLAHCSSLLLIAKVVGISGFETRPLGRGTSVGASPLLASWPPARGVLPGLLPAVDGQVEQPIAIVH